MTRPPVPARRGSVRARLMRRILRTLKNTAPIAVTVQAKAAKERDGRPDPAPPPGWVTRGVTVRKELIDDTIVHQLRPRGSTPGRAVLHFHGGGYIEPMSIGHWQLAADLARRCNAEVWLPAYRLAPRQTAARTVQTGRNILTALLGTWSPTQVTVAGDSAGGGLALAVVQSAVLKDGAPALLGLFAPWVDVAMADKQEQSTESDPLLDRGRLVEAGLAYAGDLPTDDPQVSPIHGTFEGLPETWIIVGNDDILVHQNRKLHELLQANGCTTHYIEDPHMMHVHVLLPIPEGRRALRQFHAAVRATGTASPDRTPLPRTGDPP